VAVNPLKGILTDLACRMRDLGLQSQQECLPSSDYAAHRQPPRKYVYRQARRIDYSSFLGFIEEANENAGTTAPNLWWRLLRGTLWDKRGVGFLREVAATKDLVWWYLHSYWLLQ